MNTPNYDIHRIDGPVVKDVIVTVGTDTQRQSVTLLKGQYVTVIVLTNKEAQKPAGAMLSVTEKWFNQ
jgi:5S rRNA maturation endonuclease (ribonuclease M5)